MWGRGRAAGVRSKWQTKWQKQKHELSEAVAYLDAEVPSVHIVAEEQIAGAARGSAHLEKLHQIKELAVDISTHWTHKHKLVYAHVSNMKRFFHIFFLFSHLVTVAA